MSEAHLRCRGHIGLAAPANAIPRGYTLEKAGPWRALAEGMMTSALRIILVPFFLALFLASPAVADRHHAKRAEKPDDLSDCSRLAGDAAAALDPGMAAVHAVRLTGAVTLSEDQLWELVGGQPTPPLSRKEAIALVARFVQSGLFVSVAPRLDGETLTLSLTEHPQVSFVQVRGLQEFRADDIVSQLLDVPTKWEGESRKRDLLEARARECPAPLPPSSWLARVEENQVRGGILWKGAPAALLRVRKDLKVKGYPLAKIEGEVTAAGEFLVDFDEGRIGRIEVRGVDEHLKGEVEAELGLRSGDILSSGELYTALQRIQRRWPFLHPSRLTSSPHHGFAEGDWSDDEDDDDFKHAGWYGLEKDTLVIRLRSDRSKTDLHWEELFRHTPVTGFAPGLAGTLTIYDPSDRTHLMLDGAVNFNTRRHDQEPLPGATFLERLNAKERVDWLIGSRLRIPGLAIAELGGQIHNLTDTSDAWRLSSFESYLYSALLNRSEREYYRRSGVAGFITFHLFDELTAGAEYRLDQYGALPAPNGVWSIFNKSDPLYGAAPVDAGEMGSALFRLEYQSEKVPLYKVGSLWRNSETSLVAPQPRAIGLRSLNTVEVADPSLGGTFHFTKVISDNYVTVQTSKTGLLTLRLRGGGGRDLPLQKQEALGGWEALRGYDFKELRGDGSLLGTLQLEGGHFGAFLDVGTVHAGTAGWMDPKPSAGALFSIAEHSVTAEAAWRLDGKGKATPDFRVMFSVPR
jgi:hypothetical protein